MGYASNAPGLVRAHDAALRFIATLPHCHIATLAHSRTAT